ncbi:MAG: condensation domain-containing protein, partial [Cyclobacteriaceae bacterium]
TEINDILLTGLGLALTEVLGIERSALKLEGHGREDIIQELDVSRTVGWFTSMYPLVIDLSGSEDIAYYLVNIKESLRKIPSKGIGYGILKYLSEDKLNDKLSPEIVFNYLGDFGTGVTNAEGSLFDYVSESIGRESSEENVIDAKLDISGIMIAEELSLSVRYSKSRYNELTVQKIGESFEKHLKSIIGQLSAINTTYLTPSDLSFTGLQVEELAALNGDNTLEDVYELSPLQEGIYYHWLADGSGSLYFEQTSYRVRANDLDIKKLKRAYDRLINRHGVLRTSFSNKYAGRSLQIVKKEVPSMFSFEQADQTSDAEKFIQEVKEKDREKGFDLTSPSQMRLHVIKLTDSEYEFIWSHHHILMDGWCVSVLISDFNSLLNEVNTGIVANLSAVRPYSTYINWLRGLDSKSSMNYWQHYLSEYSEVAKIPFRLGSDDTTVYKQSKELLQISEELYEKMDAFCSDNGITHNSFIRAVWGSLLSFYNDTNDVIFGSVVSGRPAELPGVEEMIGLFINTIPVRVKYDLDTTPVDLLKKLQEQSIESTSHHYMNLSEVQAQSELGINLIDHIIIFENYAVKELGDEETDSPENDRLSIESVELFERTNYDFNIIVTPSEKSLSITIDYNGAGFEQKGVRRLIGHFNQLISQFIDKPTKSISRLG